MKLLYITNGINGSGGLERVLSIKASYLAENCGYDVTIVSLNDNHINPFYSFSSKVKMLSISVTGSFFRFYKEYCQGVNSIVATVQPDVINVCDDGLKGFFVPTILRTKIPIIYERHASIYFNTQKPIVGKVITFVMRKLAGTFDRFVVLTNGNSKEWFESNTVVIPNPISLYPSAPAALENKKIIVVGSHSYNKGYDLMLQVWEKVKYIHPNWQLHFYGKIDAEKTYIHLAKELALETSVFFHEAVATIEDKYLESSLLVLPSRTEGFGMVLIEAMACGLPCVAFDCPSGPRDIIANEQDGYLIEAENIDKMTAKILLLIDNQELRQKLGLRARENIKRYQVATIIQQWDTMFKIVMKCE